MWTSPLDLLKSGILALVIPLALYGCGEGLSPTPTQPPEPVDEPPTEPEIPEEAVRVLSTDPSTAPRNSTVEVRITGTGFRQDTEAFWALDGDTTFATTRIRTLATEFVASDEIRATIAIAVDAPLAAFDVGARVPGTKKGLGLEIGTDLFEVVHERVDLGFIGSAEALNDRGQVVGRGGTESGAFLWHDGVLTDIGAPPGFQFSQAADINEAGQVVGTSLVQTGSGEWKSTAWIWTAEGGFTLLPTLGGARASADAINAAGEVVGSSQLPGDEGLHAVLWRDGVPIDLHTLPEGTSSAWDINNQGEVVGVVWGEPGGSFRWTEAGGMEVIVPSGEALGINDEGRIVGWAEPEPGAVLRAFTWEAGAGIALALVKGEKASVATAINEAGVMVGGSGRLRTAALWLEGHAQAVLDGQLNPSFGQANDVNSLGWIVGERGRRATLWKALP